MINSPGIQERIINKVYVIATGKPSKRNFLAPFVGLIFVCATSLFIIIPLWIENYFNIIKFPGAPYNIIISLPLVITGSLLMIWTNVMYFRLKGTPVPINPPQKLITNGPFAFSRNPMHGGQMLIMFGIGIYFSSILAVFIFIPFYIIMDVWMLKNIEEPELIKRLGSEYIEYRNQTPMFLGRKKK